MNDAGGIPERIMAIKFCNNVSAFFFGAENISISNILFISESTTESYWNHRSQPFQSHRTLFILELPAKNEEIECICAFDFALHNANLRFTQREWVSSRLHFCLLNFTANSMQSACSSINWVHKFVLIWKWVNNINKLWQFRSCTHFTAKHLYNQYVCAVCTICVRTNVCIS